MSDERTITQLRLENRNQVERIKALQAEVKKHHDVMVEIRKERDRLRGALHWIATLPLAPNERSAVALEMKKCAKEAIDDSEIVPYSEPIKCSKCGGQAIACDCAKG